MLQQINCCCIKSSLLMACNLNDYWPQNSSEITSATRSKYHSANAFFFFLLNFIFQLETKCFPFSFTHRMGQGQCCDFLQKYCTCPGLCVLSWRSPWLRAVRCSHVPLLPSIYFTWFSNMGTESYIRFFFLLQKSHLWKGRSFITENQQKKCPVVSFIFFANVSRLVVLHQIL